MAADALRVRGTHTIGDAWTSGHNHFNAIRLFAAWLVIYGHAWAITGTPGGDLLARATGFKYAGAIAVDMFFVISGFLIAASLQRNTVRGYLASRAPLPDWLANDLWCVVCFITGTAAWLYRDRVRLTWIAVVAFLLVAVLLRGTPYFALPYFGLVCYGTLWLAFARVPAGFAHHDFSYGLYLYGWPAAQLVQTWSPGGPLHNVAWASVFAFALAVLSWFCIERPALRFKRAFGTRTPMASPATG